MSRLLRQILSILVVALLAVLLFYASYLPMRKAQLYIRGLSSTSLIRSWDDFTGTFNPGLSAPAPYGQDELLKNFGGSIITSLIDSAAKEQPIVAKAATNYYMQYAAPLLERERGVSFVQLVQSSASVFHHAYVMTSDETYALETEKLYKYGLTLSPDRAQFVYGLFDIYRDMHRYNEAYPLGLKILDLWADPRIALYLSKFPPQAIEGVTSNKK